MLKKEYFPFQISRREIAEYEFLDFHRTQIFLFLLEFNVKRATNKNAEAITTKAQNSFNTIDQKHNDQTNEKSSTFNTHINTID